MIGVSIVMPAYNAEKYISLTIESILKQTYTEWELVVINDCSSDNTATIVCGYANNDSRVRLVNLPQNFGGPAGPRNVGVNEAKFDIIAFCDTDDVWHPEKLEKQLSYSSEESDFFCCSMIKNFRSNDEISFHSVGDMAALDVDFMKQSLRSQIPTSSVIVSKSLMLKFPFNEESSYKAVEDYHCWLRILGSGVVCKKIQFPLVFYRICDGQISGSKINMMKKVFMVHRNYDGRGFMSAVFYTLSHMIGGIYFRLFKGVM